MIFRWLIDWNHDLQLFNQSINQSSKRSKQQATHQRERYSTYQCGFCTLLHSPSSVRNCAALQGDFTGTGHWAAMSAGVTSTRLNSGPTSSRANDVLWKKKCEQTTVSREKPKTGQFKQQSSLFESAIHTVGPSPTKHLPTSRRNGTTTGRCVTDDARAIPNTLVSQAPKDDLKWWKEVIIKHRIMIRKCLPTENFFLKRKILSWLWHLN